MNNNIDDKLHSMPEAKLSNEQKDKMLVAILSNQDKFNVKRQNKRMKEWFISTAGVAVAIILVMIIFVLPNQGPTQQAFVAEELLMDLEELQSFDLFEVQLPTYAPFEVENVVYNTMYVGPIDLHQPENNYYAEPDDPNNWAFEIFYEGKNREKELQVHITRGILEYDDIDDHDEVVEFGNGKEGKFRSTENMAASEDFEWTKQFLLWQEGAILIEIGVTNQNGEPTSVDEMIRIAKSFKDYTPLISKE